MIHQHRHRKSMISWNKIITLLICSLSVNITMQAQTVYYYQLTKTKINDIVSTQNKGGQFIRIYDDFCFDCDKNGKGVNNGQLHLKNKGEYITYFGESYFGKNSYYKFNQSFSNLNIITPKGDIYAYKRTTPPSGVTTCTLIKSKSSSSSSSGATSGYIPTPTYNGGWNNTQPSSTYESTTPTPTPRQKTKVRNKCPYCTNGERIQHESVSTFGVDGPRVYCSICNKYFSYGTVHAHHKCNHCDGKGYTEYEY